MNSSARDNYCPPFRFFSLFPAEYFTESAMLDRVPIFQRLEKKKYRYVYLEYFSSTPFFQTLFRCLKCRNIKISIFPLFYTNFVLINSTPLLVKQEDLSKFLCTTFRSIISLLITSIVLLKFTNISSSLSKFRA